MASRAARRTRTNVQRPGGLTNRRAGRGVARYYQLYELLSGALADGTIPAGSALPSEPELVSRYKVSRTTVRRALARLEDEGRIVRRRGSGTYARQSREPERLYLNLDTFYEDAPTLAEKTAATVLRFESDVVPAGLREMQPQIGSHALVIQTVRRDHGTPFELSTAYVPEDAGRRIQRTALTRGSLLKVLDGVGGRVTKTEHSTSAVAADATAARRLDVSLGTPLLRMRAVLWDARGHLRAIYESLCRSDRFHLRAALERNSTRGSQTQWRLKA